MKLHLVPLLKFGLAGGLNTGFGYLSYAALVLTGLPLWLAVTGSTILAIVFNFYSYGGLVFGETSRRFLPKFVAFYAALGFGNYSALKGLTHIGVGPLVAQAILVPVLAIIGYGGMRLIVFR